MPTASQVTSPYKNIGQASREAFTNYLSNGINKVIERFASVKPQGLQFFIEDSQNQDTIIRQPIIGLGLMQKNRDEDDIALDAPSEGFRNTVSATGYRLGIKIPRSMMETDQYGKIKSSQTRLVRSANMTVEYIAADVFNRGASSTDNPFVCADGIQLFGSRNFEDSSQGTWTNAETAAAFNENALFDMRLSFQNNKDERGLTSPIEMKSVLGPANLERKFYEVAKSDKRPNDAQNASNFFMGLDYKINNWLTNTTAWFGFGPMDADTHELHWDWWARLSTSTFTAGNNDDVFFQKVRFRSAVSCDRPHNIRRNAGA